ncbi:MAG: LD-carboxypeptidase [bacterium]|nr:LD-carboxypeptidase [bacterium]
MNYPNPIHPGDTVGLIAPCSPVAPSKLNTCITTIQDMGMNVVLGESVSESLHGYLAGSDEVRADDLNSMFHSPAIDAIFCLRGGYGSTRLMPLLDYPTIAKNPKLFVGYSDITSFHLAFHKLCNFITFHGPMVSSNMINDYDDYTKCSFEEATRMPDTLSYHSPDGTDPAVIVKGNTCGRIIGGCLSLVSPSIGTFYQPDFNGKLLFLEDIGETLPRIDKMMYHLSLSCVFDQVAGVILGNFTDCENPSDPSYDLFAFFKDFFHFYKKPVLYGVQSGHGKPMATIPFGTVCTVNTYANELFFEYR